MAVQSIDERGVAWRRFGVAAWGVARDVVAAQADRWILWRPVALGCGAAIYIGQKTEPNAFVAIVPALVLIVAAFVVQRLGRNKALSVLAVLLALGASGFAAGKLRTLAVDGPVVPAGEAVTVRGWVVDVATPGESGGRLLIAPVSIGGVPNDRLPARIRLTVGENLIAPGTAIRLRGLVGPPPPPAAPGSYDFARNAFFDGIGGVGVALTEPRITTLDAPPWRLALEMKINAVRWNLAQRIAAKMSAGSAGLGAAMATGQEAFIDKATEDALRDAGLAHIISISGLHMAIVGGFAFMLARWVIAAWPWLALRVPGKKIAAVFGLIAVASYLVISGAPPPAERAALTAAVAFGAILVDRRALSLHTLSLAAIIVILLQPEAVAEAGFQMSFAATAALVALAERWQRQPREINTPWPIRLVQGAGAWIAISLAASFVAGLATGPFAIQHFNRVALYGLPANLVTEPLSTFVIMPFLAIGSVLEGFGVGGPFLAIAGYGIDLMTAGARWVAAQPHAVMLVASAPTMALPVAFLGILWLCLWKGWLRLIGLPAALAVSLWPRPEAPTVWIAADGAAAAVRQADAAILMRPDTKLFAAELWARRKGLDLPEDGEAAQAGVYDCTSQSCRALYTDGPRVSAWWTVRKPKPEVFDALCQSSDIVVMKAQGPAPASCKGVQILRPADFVAGGSVEIYRDGRMVWAQPLRGARPWTSGSGG